VFERWNELLEDKMPEPWMQALFILGVSVVGGVLLRIAITASVVRWVTKTETDIDDRIVEVLRRPVFFSVLLVGMALSTRALQAPIAVELALIRSIQTVAVLMWMVASFRLGHLLLRLFAQLADRVPWIQPTTVPLVENLVRVFLMVVASYLLMKVWALDVAPWLASAGVVGLALGFAAKDTLANLFGGFFIIIDGPYKIGDYINLDTGERGEVTGIGLRSTRILTRDDIEVTIPNAQIANSKIINEAGGRWEKSRIRVKVGVAYGSEIERVKQVMLESAEKIEYCVGEPSPRVRFREFGESSLNFELLVWIESPEFRGRCIDALLTDIYQRFRGEGIEIPFPQRDLHLRSGGLPSSEG